MAKSAGERPFSFVRREPSWPQAGLALRPRLLRASGRAAGEAACLRLARGLVGAAATAAAAVLPSSSTSVRGGVFNLRQAGILSVSYVGVTRSGTRIG